ncbi:MAG: zinc ribbon domain-containing protein [Actinobacteria bacterium]|nr:zinc ribbon domain-containing protein [Actinomycetota bacterium]
MPGYKLPCRYCGKVIPPQSNVCPICGKANPIFLRCPRCKDLIEKGWVNCPSCGLSLKVTCPKCKAETFFGDYCEKCGSPLTIVCPNPKCRFEQPPIGDKCVKCGKPLYPPQNNQQNSQQNPQQGSTKQ